MAPGDSVVGLDPLDELLEVLEERIAVRDRRSNTAGASAHLTPREVEVARLLCLGRNNAEIATTICVSLSTTRRHVEHIFAKLGVHRRAEVLARLLLKLVPLVSLQYLEPVFRELQCACVLD